MKNIAPELERLLQDYRSELSAVKLAFPAASLPELLGSPPPNITDSRAAAWGAVGTKPAPAPATAAPAPFRFGRIAVLVILAAFSAAGVRTWFVQAAQRAQQSFPLPSHVGALAFQGSNLVAVDPQRQLLFTLATDGSGVRVMQKIQNTFVSGLTFGNGCLWSSNAESGFIFQHNLDRDHTVRRAFANPDQNPAALYWDGAALWSSDARTETVYQYSVGDALTPIKQFALPKVSPAGLYVSDNLLWVFDSVTLKLYRYRMGVALTAVDSLELGSRLPPNSTVTGFSVDRSNLWLTTEKPDGLHRFDLKSLFLMPKKG